MACGALAAGGPPHLLFGLHLPWTGVSLSELVRWTATPYQLRRLDPSRSLANVSVPPQPRRRFLPTHPPSLPASLPDYTARFRGSLPMQLGVSRRTRAWPSGRACRDRSVRSTTARSTSGRRANARASIRLMAERGQQATPPRVRNPSHHSVEQAVFRTLTAPGRKPGPTRLSHFPGRPRASSHF